MTNTHLHIYTYLYTYKYIYTYIYILGQSHLVGLMIPIGRWQTSVRVSAKWSPEEQNERFWLVYFIVCPASALLHSQCPPLHFTQQSVTRHILKQVLRQHHMSILIQLILVFLTVYSLIRVVGHYYLLFLINLYILYFIKS